MSVQDVIKKSVLESDLFNQAISLSTILTIIVNLAVALAMGLVIYHVYKKFYNGVVYSRNYAVSLIGMTVLTCMVTLAISTNIVISLGMVGALSIMHVNRNVEQTYLFVIHYEDKLVFDEIIRSLGKAPYLIRSQII